jgi:molybdopterin-guanine dinucleotide biosynthesis protein A
MGQDKALVELAGRPLAAHVVDRLARQCCLVVLNGPRERLGGLGLPVVPDQIADAGPLAGLLAGLTWLRRHAPTLTWLCTAPVDTPFLPLDLVARLHAGRGERPAAIATSGSRRHGVVGLWHGDLRAPLARALEDERLRRVDDWTRRVGAAEVDFGADASGVFANLNTPVELTAARRRLEAP